MTATTVGISRTPKVGVLGERNMQWYLGGQLASLTGSMLQSAVLSLFILKLTGTVDAAYWVGMVVALNLVPGIFLGPFAGILLDRWDKRKILIVTGFLGAVQSLALAYLIHINRITIFEICLLTLLMGFVNAIDGPGRNVIVKDAVLHEYNARSASKMFTSLYNLAQVVGPGSAGYLILSYGYPFTFVLNSVSFLILIGALAMMRLIPKTTQTASAEFEKQGVWKLVTDGARYSFSEPGIRACILLTAFVCTFGFSYYSILPVIARDMLGGSLIVYSQLAASSGIGAFLGSLIVIGLGERISHKFIVAAGTILLGATLVALSQTSSIHFAIALLFAAGFSFVATFSTLRSSIVHLAKQELAGIVMGFTFTFFFGGMMLGSFGAGYVANRWGCAAELAVCGTTLGIVGLLIPFLPGVTTLDRK